MRTISVIQSSNALGESILVQGWVHSIRNMGKITFIDLRDQTGLLQVVVPGELEIPHLGLEFVIAIEGEVRKRGERFVNEKLATGAIELGATKVTVLAAARELPFEIKKDTLNVNEEMRLKYRYLDLRTQRMSANLKARHRALVFMRNYFDQEGFIEVETPMLTKGTPEGSREYLVPSRLHSGEFYVLPQSPQQFKQLLMVGGVGRYLQVAKCLRDEDQRGDRQPEFTQIDLEMSFVTQEDVLALNEAMIIDLIKNLYPEKRITTIPFPRLTYATCMEKYGNDKPDLRKDPNDPNELAFTWVVDFPMFEEDTKTQKINAVHHPFTAPLKDDVDQLSTSPMKVRADAYDIALNGYEIGGGSIRIHDPKLQHEVFSILGLQDEEISSRFGHMLEAFTYGVPPHGGIAYGFDRLIMILANEPNIREVIAFPKTGDARDPLMGAPSKVSDTALQEAHITIHSTKPQTKKKSEAS